MAGIIDNPSDADLIREAREWVADCMWREDPEEIEEYSDATIKRGVNRHYEGGWLQFVFDVRGAY